MQKETHNACVERPYLYTKELGISRKRQVDTDSDESVADLKQYTTS